MVVSLMAIGIVLNISRMAHKKEQDLVSGNHRRFNDYRGRKHSPHNVSQAESNVSGQRKQKKHNYVRAKGFGLGKRGKMRRKGIQ
jgi:hypothetical protein